MSIVDNIIFEVNMTKKKFDKQTILKYVFLFFVCLILANANLNSLSPFLFAFYFALLYVGIDEKLSAGFVLVSHCLINPNKEQLFVVLTVVAVGLIGFYIHKISKKKLMLITNFITYLISLVTYIYYNYLNYKSVILYILLGFICLFVFTVVLQVLLLRKNCFKLTLDESVCFIFALITLGLGLTGLTIFKVELYRFFIALTILICVAIGNFPLTCALTLSLSFGVAVGLNSLVPVAEFVILAMLGGVFKLPNKYKIVFTIILSDVFVDLYFLSQNTKLIYGLIPIFIACVVFVLLPNKLINSLADLIYIKNSEMSSRNLINTTRKNLRKRMSELSNVFLEMKQLHLNMLKKELTKDELIAMLYREVGCVCCKDCLEKSRCNRSLGTDNKSNLQAVLEVAVTKGKLTLLDIPSALTNRCGKINNLINLVNRLNAEYKQYKNMMADVNNVKILLADQMGAVSNLLISLGDEIDSNVSFDIAKENKIISRLLSQNIFCKEVLLYTEKNDNLSAVLVVKADNVYNPILEKVISETLKCKMVVDKISPLPESNFLSVSFKKKSKFDCVFGLASCNKAGNSECGDCHSIMRLNNNKFLLALCDGMGAGENAHKTSAMTLGLIEDFYKVGFDNDTILESVNKLLAVNNQENYSTLDVCLLDLDREIADFIKVGSPFGLIKRAENIEVVNGGALPIGALDNITPAVTKTAISTKDIVIMATDGIIDAFNSQTDLVDFVSKLASTNPQTLAETILNEALRLNNMSAKDDMTVLVARTFLKN